MSTLGNPSARTPRLSVVIPAFNEEKCIRACLESVSRAALQTRAARRCGVERIVVDNNSTDATAAFARAAGARVLFEPHNQIARARNCGARAATGEWLLFLDADSILSPGLLADALRALEGGETAGGGAVLQFQGTGNWILLGGMHLWNLLSRSLRIAAGAFLFCRADLFREIGGFDERLYAGEEIDFSRRIKQAARHRRLRFRILADHPLVTSGRKADLYSLPSILRFVIRTVLSPRKTLGDPARCHLWYDGRR